MAVERGNARIWPRRQPFSLPRPRFRPSRPSLSRRERRGRRRSDVDNDGLPGALGDDRIDLVEAAPVLTEDEKRAAVRTAQGVGEAWPVELDAIEDLPAVAHPYRDAGRRVSLSSGCSQVTGAAPDGTFGVDADAVGSDVVRPDTSVGQSAVGGDRERGQAPLHRFGNDKGRAVRGDDHAVGEVDVVGYLADGAVGRNQGDDSRWWGLAG